MRCEITMLLNSIQIWLFEYYKMKRLEFSKRLNLNTINSYAENDS